MSSSVTTPHSYNLTLTNADTEYSLLLPSGIKDFRFRCRDDYAIRFSFEAGKVAGPADPYLTLPSGADYFSDQNDLTEITLYFASAQAGVVVEIEAWS